MQKTLEDAGSKLDSVAADVLGAPGRAMLKALVAGERDPGVLAELAKGRPRAKLPQLRQALRGRFGGHHALLVRLALAHLDQLEASIAELDTHIDRVLAPFVQARDQLDTTTGVGKRAAECIIAEVGTDMTVLPTAAHLASWVGRCPGNNPDRRQAPLRQADQGQPLAGRGADLGAPGRRRAAATPTCRPSCWRLARRIGK